MDQWTGGPGERRTGGTLDRRPSGPVGRWTGGPEVQRNGGPEVRWSGRSAADKINKNETSETKIQRRTKHMLRATRGKQPDFFLPASQIGHSQVRG